jgi:hypothetical protein
MLWATICVWREASPFVAGKIIMENGAKRHNAYYRMQFWKWVAVFRKNY